MRIARTIAEAREICSALRCGESNLSTPVAGGLGVPLGLVPTMGALHAGHVSLIRTAKAECPAVAVSIFVNPTQFGPTEDFARYPRPFARDVEILESEGIDLLFCPEVDEMYPPGASTIVEVEGPGTRMDGASRPGHFRGVATVVSKLFNVFRPDRAYFGQKDAAQCAVILRMVRDLCFDLRVRVCPIVREPDGLAVSSRNIYLTREQRQMAPLLYRALNEARAAYENGLRNGQALIQRAKQLLSAQVGIAIDYFGVFDPATLEPVSEIGTEPALVAIAAFLGQTRLIDNVLLNPGHTPDSQYRID